MNYPRMFLIIPALFSITSAVLMEAIVDGATEDRSLDQKVLLSAQMEKAWEVTWTRFYLPKTNLFYDYISSYETGKELSHLPTISEIQSQTPNECGYDTGMEDCMISAGIMMSMIVDRFTVTGEESLKNRAYQVFKGIRRCATAHGVPGFLARAVSHEDLSSVYPNSSRDQYTHAVFGLWLYARSPLCPPQVRTEVGEVLSAIADRMEQNVIEKNHFDSLRIDGSRDSRGISRMWNVQAHEAARLPMIYACAWDVTKNPRYRALWRKYVETAVKQSSGVADNVPTYALLQTQESLSVLLKLETEQALINEIQSVMSNLSDRCDARWRTAAKRAQTTKFNNLPSDWRKGGGLADPDYRKEWYCIRECGESMLAQLTEPNRKIAEDQLGLFNQLILDTDFQHVSSNGIFYIQAAYWKLQALSVEP